MEEAGAGLYEGTTNFMEQKQVEWKRARSCYGDVTYWLLFTCMEAHWFFYISRVIYFHGFHSYIILRKTPQFA